MGVIACHDLGIRFARGSRRAMLRAALPRLLRGQTGGGQGEDAPDSDPAGALWALRHVGLEVPLKSCLGVCGTNGAGKTTLLRLLAGVYRPDEGRATVHGRSSALLSLGAGVSHNLSGRENVFVAGAVRGLDRRQTEELYPAICDFAELDEATMRTPVRYYSSGMRTRLGFSIAAVLVPDVLLLDEILTVGDPAFRKKSATRLRELIHQARCIVLSSHSVSFLKAHCDLGLWLHQGKVMASGPGASVFDEYACFMGIR